MTKRVLKNEVAAALERQGYRLQAGEFLLPDISRETVRNAHKMSRDDRVARHRDFICAHAPLAREHLIDGADLNVRDISPVLKKVKPGSKWETLFRWWNFVWWSLPWEKAYGRQMRYVVWDRHHRAVIGLIGLQSPILSWTPRDRHLGVQADDRDFWINQSLSAQRLGALPPYNQILGGKLVALTMTANSVRRDFREKYQNKKTILYGRKLPANLLFITTTGAFGKSSIYTRLTFKERAVAEFAGYSEGAGSFHIPDRLYEKIVGYLSAQGIDAARGFGNGPSRKMRLIQQGMNLLGFKCGNRHGVRRAVYVFPLASNLQQMIAGKHSQPKWIHRTIAGVTDFWKGRWSLPRLEKNPSCLDFDGGEYVNEQLQLLEQPR